MVCSSDTTTAGPGKRADHRVFWNRLLQNAKASYGLPVARQARYEDRLSQKLSPADLMEKLQLGLSNWRRAEASETVPEMWSSLRPGVTPSGLEEQPDDVTVQRFTVVRSSNKTHNRLHFHQQELLGMPSVAH
ncbi:hypothetical protein RRG08_018892 [Elysia crispata]|uniref:Uncharacterized protein n=1 Tax=Elysia crispata TaxID=231223 RepID=A0AAE1DUQ9_9GAST|nr:hypothetical protein RRG08_018892 [Elysia crispata]